MEIFRCPGCGRFAAPEADAPSVHGCPGCGGAVPDEGAPQTVSLTGLGEAIRAAPVPLLVEFFAADCEPCAASAVVLDALGHRLAGQVVVLRVDVEEASEACEAHGILAVPTLVLFSGGRARGRRVGPLKARELEAWVRGLDQPSTRRVCEA